MPCNSLWYTSLNMKSQRKLIGLISVRGKTKQQFMQEAQHLIDKFNKEIKMNKNKKSLSDPK